MNLAIATAAGRRVLDRVAGGETLRSWDVHHSVLQTLIRHRLVTCGIDCVVRLP